MTTEVTQLLKAVSPLEFSVEPWKHLVARVHPWRRQLYLEGRNMTVRQLVGGIFANKHTEESAAADFDLPVECIREQLALFALLPNGRGEHDFAIELGVLDRGEEGSEAAERTLFTSPSRRIDLGQDPTRVFGLPIPG